MRNDVVPNAALLPAKCIMAVSSASFSEENNESTQTPLSRGGGLMESARLVKNHARVKYLVVLYRIFIFFYSLFVINNDLFIIEARSL
jgi:hypothetical protein